MKKFGILAALIVFILYILNRLRNETTIEVDTDE